MKWSANIFLKISFGLSVLKAGTSTVFDEAAETRYFQFLDPIGRLLLLLRAVFFIEMRRGSTDGFWQRGLFEEAIWRMWCRQGLTAKVTGSMAVDRVDVAVWRTDPHVFPALMDAHFLAWRLVQKFFATIFCKYHSRHEWFNEKKVSPTKGFQDQFRTLFLLSGWEPAVCVVWRCVWSLSLTETGVVVGCETIHVVDVVCPMSRPCNTDNDNLCEPYGFALNEKQGAFHTYFSAACEANFLQKKFQWWKGCPVDLSFHHNLLLSHLTLQAPYDSKNCTSSRIISYMLLYSYVI